MDILPVVVAAINAAVRLVLALVVRRREVPMKQVELKSPRKLLNSRELARELGVSRQTVCDMTRAGRIPCLKISERTRRYDLAAVLAALGKGTE